MDGNALIVVTVVGSACGAGLAFVQFRKRSRSQDQRDALFTEHTELAAAIHKLSGSRQIPVSEEVLLADDFDILPHVPAFDSTRYIIVQMPRYGKRYRVQDFRVPVKEYQQCTLENARESWEGSAVQVTA